jgi:hypothetical protein
MAPADSVISRITLLRETGSPMRAAVAVVSPTSIGDRRFPLLQRRCRLTGETG